MRGRSIAVWLLFLLLPFLLFAWALPFVAPQTIGNDYVMFGPSAQLNLMWSAWRGTFPLYMPGFAGGHSTASMTLGGLYHPASWLASAMPGYSRGLVLEWNTFFRLLSLGVTHLALFALARRLSLGTIAAFIASFPIVYNLRMLDSFRYWASFESYIGMVLAMAAAGFVFLEPRSRRAIAFLAAATYFSIVGGHPQWGYLCTLAVGLFAVACPWLMTAVDSAIPPLAAADIGGYLKRALVGAGSGTLLAAPYLTTFYFEYLVTNRARAQNDYQWTLGFADTLQGQLANFIRPLHADVHGAFGGSALFLITAAFPIAALVKKAPRALWIAWALGLFVFLFAVGKESWVHALVVPRMPFFGSFRVPGRLVLWLPVVAFPLLAWMLQRANRAGLFAVSATSAALCLMYWLWSSHEIPQNRYSPHKIIKDIPPWVDSVIAALSGITTASLALAAKSKGLRALLWWISAAAMIATTAPCLAYGTWRAKPPKFLTFEQISQWHQKHVTVPPQTPPGFGMEMRSVSDYRARRLRVDAPLATIHHRVEAIGSDDEVLARLQQGVPKQPLYLDRAGSDLPPAADGAGDEITLRYNTSNRHVFDVTAAADGYVVIGLPWLPGFTARLDGRPVELAKANALHPAVFVPRGVHVLDVRFASRPFLAGMAVALATLAVWIATTAGAGRSARFKRIAAAVTALGMAMVAASFWLWLFHGPSFGTSYQWKSTPNDIAR
jgi:hypothetical protein